jgi:hypothetical protein
MQKYSEPAWFFIVFMTAARLIFYALGPFKLHVKIEWRMVPAIKHAQLETALFSSFDHFTQHFTPYHQ